MYQMSGLFRQSFFNLRVHNHNKAAGLGDIRLPYAMRLRLGKQLLTGIRSSLSGPERRQL
jgi:hypothetical protein